MSECSNSIGNTGRFGIVAFQTFGSIPPNVPNVPLTDHQPVADIKFLKFQNIGLLQRPYSTVQIGS